MATEDDFSRLTASKEIIILLDRIEELKTEIEEGDPANNDDYVHQDYRYDECPGCEEYSGALYTAKEEIEAAQLAFTGLKDLKDTLDTLENRLDDAHRAATAY